MGLMQILVENERVGMLLYLLPERSTSPKERLLSRPDLAVIGVESDAVLNRIPCLIFSLRITAILLLKSDIYSSTSPANSS